MLSLEENEKISPNFAVNLSKRKDKIMRKVIALAFALLVLAVAGCSPAQKTYPKDQLIKCTTCGVEFTLQEGLDAYEAAHDH